MQVHASAKCLKLITFDADGTLYADGQHIQADNEMIQHILDLLWSQACFLTAQSVKHSCVDGASTMHIPGGGIPPAYFIIM